MKLTEWVVQHVKQKDIIKGDLTSYKEEQSKVVCEYKETKATYFCEENLSLEKIKSVNDNETNFFVCKGNEHDFKLLTDNWNLFKTKKNLAFIFLNPSMQEKWVIKPYVHSKIAQAATLKQGLRTMYDTCMGNDKQ